MNLTTFFVDSVFILEKYVLQYFFPSLESQSANLDCASGMGWGVGDQETMNLKCQNDVFSILIREVIFLISKEFVILEKIFFKIYFIIKKRKN